MRTGNEYEMIRYTQLHHVEINIVSLIYRNFHMHREMELGLVLDGAAQISCRGKSFKVGKGSIFFFNPGQPHELLALNSTEVRIAYIQIANNFARDYLPRLRNLEILWNDLTSHLTAEQHAKLTRRTVRTVYEYLTDDSQQNQFHWMSNILRLLTALLDDVPHVWHEESPDLAERHKSSRLSRVIDYIDKHYTEKISLNTLAEQEGITTTHMSHFIHDNLNMTFQEYVSNMRFEKAVKLMENSKLQLIDICMESGFSDVRYMNRMFEEHFGCSPKEYRRNHPPELTHDDEPKQSQEFVPRQTGMVWLENFMHEIGIDYSKPDR